MQQAVNALCCRGRGAELTARWGISRTLSLRITRRTERWHHEGISIQTHKYTLGFVTKGAKLSLQAFALAARTHFCRTLVFT